MVDALALDTSDMMNEWELAFVQNLKANYSRKPLSRKQIQKLEQLWAVTGHD
jgi:hypothetical protein